MGWEQRRGRRYYYRKQRRDGRVLSEYVGAGAAGEQAAMEDAARRRQRSAARRHERDARADATLLDTAINDLQHTIADRVTSLLEVEGYHEHRGEWRRQRVRT
jgi:hypothetical protein